MGTTPGRVLPGKKKWQVSWEIKLQRFRNLSYSNRFRRKYFSNKGSVPGKPGNLLSIVPSE
jgi:hypothetical protein